MFFFSDISLAFMFFVQSFLVILCKDVKMYDLKSAYIPLTMLLLH